VPNALLDHTVELRLTKQLGKTNQTKTKQQNKNTKQKTKKVSLDIFRFFGRSEPSKLFNHDVALLYVHA